MAKFIFSMQSILNIKMKLEDQAKAEYGLAIALLHEEEEKLQILQNRRLDIQNQLREAMSSTLDILNIRTLEQGIEIIKVKEKTQEFVIEAQKRKVDLAREKLDEAMKERKTYEKLKEKAFENFKQEITAQEQKEVDELESFRFGTKKESED